METNALGLRYIAMRITYDVKSKFLYLVLLPLLGGCYSETASYMIGTEQALTIVRDKVYPWDEEYRRAIVVMSRPKCITRYKMPPDSGNIGKVEVYDSGEGYYVLKDKAGQYMANLADCSMFAVDKKIEDPGELKGAFDMTPAEPPRFVFTPAKLKPKAPAPAPTNESDKVIP